jgi:hypothetical protein
MKVQRPIPVYPALLLAGIVVNYCQTSAFSAINLHTHTLPRTSTASVFCGSTATANRNGSNKLCSTATKAADFSDSEMDSQAKPAGKDIQEDVPKNMPDAIRVFFFSRGPLVIAITLVNILFYRFSTLGPIGVPDVIVFVGSIVFWWFQEHFLHGKLLHSKFDWYGKRIHKDHHKKPYFHISVDPVGLMLGWLATAHLIFRLIFPVPIAISATLGYAGAGLFYEWSHFIVHTKVKPRSRFWKQMRDNHIRHHCVDENYWLAFSLPAIDDIFGTNLPIREVREKNKKVQVGANRS